MTDADVHVCARPAPAEVGAEWTCPQCGAHWRCRGIGVRLGYWQRTFEETRGRTADQSAEGERPT